MKTTRINICKILITIMLLTLLTSCQYNNTRIKETETDWSMQNGSCYTCVGYEKISWNEAMHDSRVLACSGNFVFSCEPVFLYDGQIIDESEIDDLVEDYDQFEIKTMIYKYVIEDNKLIDGNMIGEADGYVIGACVYENEKLIMTITSAADYLGLEEKGWLAMMNVDGKISFSKELDKGRCTEHLTANSNGEIFILSKNEIYTYNSKGKNVRTQKLDEKTQGWEICCDDEKGCYVISMDVALVLRKLCQGKEEIIDNTHSFTEMSRTPEGRVIAMNRNKLYVYSELTKEWQELVDFVNIDICSDDIIKWWMGKNSDLYIILRGEGTDDEYLITAQIKSKEEIPEKEVIRMAVNGTSSKFRRMAIGFNRTNEKYRIEITNYFETLGAYSTEADFEAANERLILDLYTEKKIDLIDLGVLISQDISPVGLLEDLNPYLSQHSSIQKDDFFPEVLQGATVNNSLLWLTDTMMLTTLLCQPTLQKQIQENWTVENMIKIARENPNMQLFNETGVMNRQEKNLCANHVLECALALNQPKYFENMFDREAFIQILQEAKEQYDSLSINTGEVENKNDYLLVDSCISSFDGLTYDLLESFHKQGMAAIGYPTEDGKGKSIISPYVGIGMLSSSEHKDAAWAFLEYYIQSADDRNLDYLSSVKSKFATQIKKAYEMSKQDIAPDNADYIDEESLKLLEELVDNAVGSDQKIDEEIINIVYEEVPAYYIGDKTVGEVADVIGNRVMLYLNENK